MPKTTMESWREKRRETPGTTWLQKVTKDKKNPVYTTSNEKPKTDKNGEA